MDPTILLSLAVGVAFSLGYLAGRASLSGQLDAARIALSRGVHLHQLEHTSAVSPQERRFRLTVVKSCLTCKVFDTCSRSPKPHPAPACHVSLFADVKKPRAS